MNKLAFFFFLFLVFRLPAQESMRILRTAAVDRSSPVRNVFVDADSNLWVGNQKGVFRVQSADVATPLQVGPDEQSLLNFRSGNFDLKWPQQKLQGIIGPDNPVSAAAYDTKRKELWIGTPEDGLFQLRVEPELQLIQHHTTANSRLRSNTINDIAVDENGRLWVGTDDGVLLGESGRWTLLERYFDIRAIATFSGEVWLMSSELVGKMDRGNTWLPLKIPPRQTEGELKDIAFDPDGNLWIASEVITRYNVTDDTYKVFGPAQGFTSQFVNCLAVDAEGAVWVGTDDKGLYLIEKESAMTVACVVEKEASCTGPGNDAALRVRVTGGEPPYTYAWQPAAQGDNPQNLAPGNYVVSVTDSRGQVRSARLEIKDPKVLLQVVATKAASPGGAADGQATATVEGGTPAYSFRWDNGETTPVAQKLTEGIHSVTVTDRAGCRAEASVSITGEIAELKAVITQTKTIDCFGDRTAALLVAVQGGKGPFRYQWSDPRIVGEQALGLAAGEYSVTVTDAAGNRFMEKYFVEQPEPLTGTGASMAPAGTGKADGQATVRVSGGKGGYQFRWDSGETGQTATRLPSGVHTVTVTDVAGCTTTASVEITENILPLAITISPVAGLKCYGDKTASLQVEVSGGKGPFEYRWSDPNLRGGLVTNLGAGDYQLTVTDGIGNAKIAQFSIQSPPQLTASVLATAPASTGGTDGQATVSATGGTGPYRYAWDTGETGEASSRLGPGVHTATVTDASGCTVEASVTISENILPLAVQLTQTQTIACYGGRGGALRVQVSGGKGPFRYQWSDPNLSGAEVSGLAAGDYQLTVTDAVGTSQTAQLEIRQPQALAATATATVPASTGGTDGQATVSATGGTGPYRYAWDTGETGEAASRLGPGVHTATVTDASGCTVEASVTISENILPLAVQLTQTQTIACNGGRGGALRAQVSGGKGPFRYQWSDPNLSGAEVSGLAAGVFQLTVTDAVGTSQTAQLEIRQPQVLAVTATATAPASTGGTDGQATVSATGGTGPYRYAWDTGETGEAASRLGPGVHTVTVTDASGCKAEASVTISENILPLTLALAQTSQVTCNGGRNGALRAQIQGGKAPYQYRWSDPAGSGAELAGLAAGNYTLTVSDASGQTQTAQLVIREPEALTASARAIAPAGTDKSDGQAGVSASGGTGRYSFSWDNGETSGTAGRLSPGVHTVTVTDEAGCFASASVTITENILPLSAALSAVSGIRCQGSRDGVLKVEVRGGKGPLLYQWSDPSINGSEASGLGAGEYAVTVTDATGQTQSARLTLKEPEALSIQLVSKKPAATETSRDGKATVQASGGTGRYSFRWDSGETTVQALQLAVGAHQVTVTDENGCTAELAVEIGQRIIPELTAGQLESGQIIQMQKLQFEADSTRITDEVVPVLEEVFEFLKENPTIVVEIGGHTNNLPPDDYCDRLSTARAKAVVDYLTIKGIDSNRVYYRGYGKRQPLFSNDTADGRRRNQRVEIKILRL